MNTLWSHIKKIFTHSCVCFTLLILFLFLLGSSVPSFGNAIAVGSILSVYLFSLLLACANLLLGISRIQIGFRVLLHYIVSLSAFYGVFVLIALKITAPRSALVCLLLFTIFYAIFMGVYLYLYFSIAPKKVEKKTEYQSIYK